jgi:IS5 family transposase
MLLKRLARNKKLFGFLRRHRHLLFTDDFQDELASMYRQGGQGRPPIPPAQLAMATLLQAYVGVSDAEAVELSLVDGRWRMVLGVEDEESPIFSQGALQNFRHRMIAYDMDQRLLRRTVELAKELGGFDSKKLPKSIRVAVDSRPLEGAARVEDTFNLIAHAARNLLQDASRARDTSTEKLASEIGVEMLTASSIKKALDVPWNGAADKQRALRELLKQVGRLEAWVLAELATEIREKPIATDLETLALIIDQDTEPDPTDGGARITQGTAKDRRVTVRDPDMRHGRKTKTKAFNGYKSHIAVDIDTKLIHECAITPANVPESNAFAALLNGLWQPVAAWYVDRGYISAPELCALVAQGATVICRPWMTRRDGMIGKIAFRFDFTRKIVTCPAGKKTQFRLGSTARFDAKDCDNCDVRGLCTKGKKGRGRGLNVHAQESLQVELRRLAASPEGREELRERVHVEHRLSHLAQKQGKQARYIGQRANVFDARRHAAVLNLEVTHREQQIAA